MATSARAQRLLAGLSRLGIPQDWELFRGPHPLGDAMPTQLQECNCSATSTVSRIGGASSPASPRSQQRALVDERWLRWQRAGRVLVGERWSLLALVSPVMRSTIVDLV